MCSDCYETVYSQRYLTLSAFVRIIVIGVCGCNARAFGCYLIAGYNRKPMASMFCLQTRHSSMLNRILRTSLKLRATATRSYHIARPAFAGMTHLSAFDFLIVCT